MIYIRSNAHKCASDETDGWGVWVYCARVHATTRQRRDRKREDGLERSRTLAIRARCLWRMPNGISEFCRSSLSYARNTGINTAFRSMPSRRDAPTRHRHLARIVYCTILDGLFVVPPPPCNTGDRIIASERCIERHCSRRFSIKDI